MKKITMIIRVLKKLTLKDIAFITMLVILLAIVNVAFNNYKATEEAKFNLLQKDLQVAKQEATQKSDIELLESKASTASYASEELLGEIKRLEEDIRKMTEDYETNILIVACTKEQIARKIKGLEYNVDYCKGNEVLDQFRTVPLR